MDINKPNKFNIGDIVKVKGKEYEVIEWFFSVTCDKEGIEKDLNYVLISTSKGQVENIFGIEEKDMELVSSKTLSNELNKENIDMLLDKINQYNNVHLLLNSIGIEDNEYSEKAKEIVDYLSK